MTAEGYHGLKQGENKELWKNKGAEINEDHVYIDGHPVMEKWEHAYMSALAAVAASGGGKVLEVGFGLGLSAGEFQKQDIQEHVIIEANAEVFKKLQEWATRQPHKVTPLFGLWQDVVEKLPDDDFDGIMYDAYPQNKESQHVHQFEFIDGCYRILKVGGTLTYCNLTSLGVLRPQFNQHQSDEENWQDCFETTQKPHLLKCGFSAQDIKPIELYSLTPPVSCEYYQHPTQLIPIIVKS